jgi:hypothetical protein
VRLAGQERIGAGRHALAPHLGLHAAGANGLGIGAGRLGGAAERILEDHGLHRAAAQLFVEVLDGAAVEHARDHQPAALQRELGGTGRGAPRGRPTKHRERRERQNPTWHGRRFHGDLCGTSSEAGLLGTRIRGEFACLQLEQRRGMPSTVFSQICG